MRLLPDKPMSKSKGGKVDFAYAEFAESLIELIKCAPTPFTIGMFGKWGAGKSTIIQDIEDKLDKRKYVYLKFDVWKYEADALRRSFLIDIAEQINQKKGFLRCPIDINKLENELYKAETSNKEKFKPSWRSLIVIACIMVAIFIATKLTRRPASTTSATVSAATVGVAAVIIDFFRKVDPSMLIQKVSLTRTPIGSPEQFERIFKETFLNRTSKTYVIIIDNLDRTQKDKTVELLSTIKTFLNTDASEEKVIFLIACDDKAIREHIESVYTPTNKKTNKKEGTFTEFNPNEFLRKFFNVIVELPVLIEVEVSDFTKKMLKETDIPAFESTDLQLIINYAYQQNPREIKQFVNNLAAFYLLLDKGEDKNGLSKEFLDKNLNFICKMLVFRDKYQDIFDLIRELNAQAKPWSTIADEITQSSNNKSFKIFDGLTKSWTSPTEEYVSWFFRLRRSTEDIELPGWDQFINYTAQQDVEGAAKLFETFENKVALNNQLQVHINKIASEPARITPFFAVYTKLLLSTEAETKELLRNSIDLLFQSTPPAADLTKIIGLIDVDQLIGDLNIYVQERSMNKFVRVLKEMLDIVSTAQAEIAQEHLVNIINALDRHSDVLERITGSVKTVIKNKSPSIYILETLKNKTRLKEALIDQDIIYKYIEEIPSKDSDVIRKWLVLTNYSLGNSLDLYINKTVQILQRIDGIDNAQKHEMVQAIYETLNSQSQPLEFNDDEISNVVTMTQIIDKWYSEMTEIDRKPELLLLSLLANINGNTAENFATSCLTQYINQNGIDAVVSILDEPVIQNVRLKPEIQTLIRDKMATHTTESIKLLPYLEIDHLPYVISHVRQKAIDASTEAAFLEQMSVANDLYVNISDQSTKDKISEEVLTALNGRIQDLPDAVKVAVDRRKYAYISASQKNEIQAKLRSNDNEV